MMVQLEERCGQHETVVDDDRWYLIVQLNLVLVTIH